MSTSVDPFGVFGDSDSDEEALAETEVNRIARSLVNVAKVRTDDHDVREALASSQLKSPPPEAAHADDAAETFAQTLEEVDLPWSPPLYMNPWVKVVSLRQFGGGRGCVVERTLPPGTLLLVEGPLASWSVDDNSLDLTTIHSLLERPDAAQIVHDLELFHPTKQAVDGAIPTDPEQVQIMMNTSRAQYSKDTGLQTILELAKEKNIVNSDGTPLSETDAIRLLLSLRYNGLESGIFRYAAMLNHADQPNCVKFLPTDDKKYSEVRLTRTVSAGTPLTISYVPRILSHASRRKHLWEQHRFDIGAYLPPRLREMEWINKQHQLPPSALNRWDDNSATHRIEQSVAALEEMYRDAAAEQPFQQQQQQQQPSELFEKSKALELAVLELCTQATFQLQNDKHLLLIPCLRLHMDCCYLVQSDPSLRFADRVKLLGRLVITARRLLVLQTMFHGPDHFDIARTNLDLAQAIEELLSRSPKQLLSLQQDELGSLSAWSSLENSLRKDYSRIKALYPRDAHKHIGS